MRATIIETVDGYSDAYFEYAHTEEYNDSVKRVSDYLEQLPLTKEQNDELIQLLVEHTTVTLKDGLSNGIRLTTMLNGGNQNE